MTTSKRTGLVLSGVTMRLGDGDATVTALDEVSLTVAPGELVAVVGPSGAGKSSLLAVAGALTIPDSGTVTIDGHEIAGMSAKARAAYRRDHIGFVFQSGNLLPALTALDQLRLVTNLSRRRTDDRDPANLLADVGRVRRAAATGEDGRPEPVVEPR
jgi:putative ABC transport system ATP-binding protein